MWDPDQHLERNCLFEIFLLPHPDIGHFQESRQTRSQRETQPQARETDEQMIGSRRSCWQTRRIQDAKLLTLLALFETRSELRLVLLLEKRIVISLRFFIPSRD